jgi:hypothetical protein
VEFETFKEIDDHVSKLKSPRFKVICVKSFHCYFCMPTSLQRPQRLKLFSMWPWGLQGE